MLVPNAPQNNSYCKFSQCRTLEPLMSGKPVGESLKALDFQSRSTIEIVCPLFSLYKNKTRQKPYQCKSFVACGRAGVSASRESRRYFYITISVGTDRILSSPPILTLVTWKFILSNCLFCYEHTYNYNITLSNVAISYFQTQALLSFPISCYALYASLTLNYDFLLVAV